MIFSTIGTCRLAEPLSTVSDAFERNQTNIYGYIHTAKEAIQQIGFINGRSLPAYLAPFIASKDVFPPRRPRPDADVWIVEISSLKELVLDGYYLQLNYLGRVFSNNREFLDQFWKLASKDQRVERAKILRSMAGFGELAEAEQHMLQEAYMTAPDQKELGQDLKIIDENLNGEVVFVSHVNVPNQAGKLIGQRVLLSQYLTESSRKHGLNLFDPSPLVMAFGLSEAMMENGADLNHYSEAFLPVLGQAYTEAILAPVSKGQSLSLTPEGGDETEISDVTAEDMDDGDPLLSPKIVSALSALEDSLKQDSKAVILASKTIRDIARDFKTSQRLDEAYGLMQKALEIAPDATALLKEQALLCEAVSKPEEAIRYWDTYISLESDPTILERAANLARRIGAWGDQVHFLRKIVASAPSDDAKLKLEQATRKAFVAARTAIEDGRFEEAVPLVRGLLELDENQNALALSRRVRKALNDTLNGQDVDASVEAAQWILELDPDDAISLKVKAIHLERIGKKRESAQTWERLAASSRGKDTHWAKAAKLYGLVGDVKKAMWAQESAERLKA